MNQPERTRLHWRNLLVLVAMHVAAAFAVVYLCCLHWSWWTVGFGLLWSLCCGMSITGGYHRLFSHATYRASTLLRLFYLAFGAAGVQNSALRWAADHRAHHARTDQDGDPYDIRRGFWWAHIGWIIHDVPGTQDLSLVRDLSQDRWLRLQDRWYVPLALLFGAVLPFCIGLAWGDPIGALLVAGCLRLVLQWHATFSINSFTHLVGRHTYMRSISARDSFLAALVTLGEGYHNFHHRFQIDYRNGVRWYHFDPTKWWVWTMACLGLATGLRRVSPVRIAAARRMARHPAPAG